MRKEAKPAARAGRGATSRSSSKEANVVFVAGEGASKGGDAARPLRPAAQAGEGRRRDRRVGRRRPRVPRRQLRRVARRARARRDAARARARQAHRRRRRRAADAGRGGREEPGRSRRRARGGQEGCRRRADRVKVLALDFGSARTGVAVSDPTGTLARPLCVVERAASDAGLDRLVAVIREEAAGAGRRRPAADAARRARRAGAGDRAVRRVAARAVDVPVETFDERSRRARRRDGDDAEARAPRTCSRVTWSGRARRSPAEAPPLRPSRAVAARRSRLAASPAAAGGARRRATVGRARRRDVAPRRRSRSGSSFPRASRARDMAERITAVDEIARAKRHVHPRLSRTRVPARDRRQGARRRLRASKRYPFEGFLFPATYDFFTKTTSKQLVARPARRVPENWARVNLRYARKKNLTPYDVLTIASMVEKEAQAPRERQLVAAVIYNRLHARHAARDRRDDPLRAPRSADRVAAPVAARRPDARTTRAVHRACRRRRSRIPASRRCRRPRIRRRSTTSTSSASRTSVHHFFTASYAEFENYPRAHGYG